MNAENIFVWFEISLAVAMKIKGHCVARRLQTLRKNLLSQHSDSRSKPENSKQVADTNQSERVPV
jgi:hypothetical protein